MAYQVYDVKIRREFTEKADEILFKHWNNGDINTVNFNIEKNHNGPDTVTYWIQPYIYEDFEAIKDEFKQAGIQVL